MSERVKIPTTLPKYVSAHDALMGHIKISIDPPISLKAGQEYEIVVVEKQ